MADDADQRSGDDVTEDTEDEEDTQTDVTEDEGGEGEGGSGDGEKVDKAELDRALARMRAADKAKSTAEAKLAEIEKGKLSDLEKAQHDVEELTKRATAAEEKLKSTQIENAFHRNNKFEFHDVADAIAALDLSGVEIDEDGKVTGMEAAIKDVVKRKPHFVKSQRENGSTGQPAANGALNGTRKGDERQNAATRNALKARFPALNK